ncbi:three-helix bundle dimerization domain-containing protein [Cellulomonas edaphi]|uniref:Uncharacterized protein n=1 Tax=Cellulomonas edaphi TaxID=3053468 RepID=A0ABT7S781_9CELL|nr:hypothetical protein [Cellulomons edaphi]MDM7831480.1 hypothetical protein [Cellulomons edaphi]
MPIEDEDKAIGEVVDRIAEKFPAVERERVQEAVETHKSQFDEAAVRDFVPVLVEHQVTDELSTQDGD